MRPEDIPEAARPASAGSWRFLTEQWDSDLFDVIQRPDSSYAAHFHDDDEDVPFADMAYNRGIGLFRRSQFPDEQDG